MFCLITFPIEVESECRNNHNRTTFKNRTRIKMLKDGTNSAFWHQFSRLPKWKQTFFYTKKKWIWRFSFCKLKHWQLRKLQNDLTETKMLLQMLLTKITICSRPTMMNFNLTQNKKRVEKSERDWCTKLRCTGRPTHFQELFICWEPNKNSLRTNWRFV